MLDEANTTDDWYHRQWLLGELRNCRRELVLCESKKIVEVLSQADVICCTLSSASEKTLRSYQHNKLDGRLFDVCVIDEAA
jgi:superfamily I DNA and/or RNA helicase